MTATVDVPVPSASLPERSPAVLGRRRDPSRHGMLMERAIKLRDQVPSGRRRADTTRVRSWTQVAVGLLVVSAGITTVYSTGPGWNGAGAAAVGLGPTVAMLGVIDLARRGVNGERRVERIFCGIRKLGAVVTALLIAMEVFTALVAVALLVTGVVWGNWSDEVVYFLVNALVFATLAGAMMMMVRVADLRPIVLTRASWWRELGTFRQFTNIAVPVVVVGVAAALSLRDTRGVAVAMIGLTTVLVGWARVRRTAIDDAVRRFAEAADALATASCRWMLMQSHPEATLAKTPETRCAVIEALDSLDLACHVNMRGGLPAAPRYLVDIELIIVIRACKSALLLPTVEQVGSSVTATVARELSMRGHNELAQELLIFAGDVRRLATLAPDRLVAL